MATDGSPAQAHPGNVRLGGHGLRSNARAAVLRLCAGLLVAWGLASGSQAAAEERVLGPREAQIRQWIRQIQAAELEEATELLDELADEQLLLLEEIEDYRGLPEAESPLAWDVGYALAFASHFLAQVNPELRPVEESEEELLQMAIDAMEVVGDGDRELYFRRILSTFYQSRGELARAASVLREKLLKLSEVPPQHGPPAIVELAKLARARGDWTATRELLEGLPGLWDMERFGPNHRRSRCEALGVWIQLWIHLGLLVEAEEALVELRELSQVDADPVVLRGVAQLSIEWKLAMALHAEAIAEAEQGLKEEVWLQAYPPLRSILLTKIALAESDLGNEDAALREQARRRFQKALQDDGFQGLERIEAERKLAHLELLAGNFDAVQRLVESLRERLAVSTDAHAEWSPHLAQLAALETRLRLQRGDSKQVLAATLPEFRQVFARHVEEWRGSPLRPGGLSYLQFGERRSILSQLIRLSVAVLGAEQGAREAFVQLMEVQTLGSLARSLELTAPDLQAVQRDWLPADSGILILLPSQDASHLFAVEKTRIGYWELPPWSRLRSALEHLLVTILRPPARQQNGRIAPAAQQKAQQAGRRLAELLLPEEAAAWIQRWRSMTVVGLDLLGWVPMEALVLPDGEPLGLSKAVTYVPSLPVAMMLQRRVRERPRQAPALDVFLVGAPSHDLGKGPHLPQESAIGRPAPAGIEGMNSLPVLPLDQTAAEDLLSGYPPKRTAVFLHDQATPQAVFRELQTGVRIAHFLTHGIYDGDRERPAGLLLSPDSQSFGFFWCEDVECLPPVDLAILSACGAAKGPKRQGDDGVQNLGGAFLRAGAGAVILTRAELDYYATFDLMKVLHQELLSGSGPAKAMLGARQRLAADERYQHPYYHSLLQVMGLGQRPLFAPQRGVNETAHPLWLWITVGALLIVLVAMLRRRARRVTD